jgi:hypothetical protein
MGCLGERVYEPLEGTYSEESIFAILGEGEEPYEYSDNIVLDGELSF